MSWILAVALPLLAGGAAWGWIGVTTSTRECVTGGGGGSLTVPGLAVLVIVTPIGIGWQSRRMTGSTSRAVSPIVMSILLGILAVFLGAQAWSGSHNCMT